MLGLLVSNAHKLHPLCGGQHEGLELPAGLKRGQEKEERASADGWHSFKAHDVWNECSASAPKSLALSRENAGHADRALADSPYITAALPSHYEDFAAEAIT